MPPMPPAMMGNPPPGFSPATQASGNPGQMAGAMAKVREAIHILEICLPEIPSGTEPHEKLLKAITSLNSVFPASEASPGVGQTAIHQLARTQQREAPMVAMMRALQGQGAAGMTGQQPEQQAA